MVLAIIILDAYFQESLIRLLFTWHWKGWGECIITNKITTEKCVLLTSDKRTKYSYQNFQFQIALCLTKLFLLIRALRHLHILSFNIWRNKYLELLILAVSDNLIVPLSEPHKKSTCRYILQCHLQITSLEH